MASMSTIERSMPPLNASERETLEAWLDYYRATLLLTCQGVDADALRQRSAEPSELSLQGLLQHLGEVERQWFRRVMFAEELPTIYPGGKTSQGHDGGFDVDPSVPFITVVGQWEAEIAAARANCAERSLDDTAAFMGTRGEPTMDLQSYDQRIRTVLRPSGHPAREDRREPRELKRRRHTRPVTTPASIRSEPAHCCAMRAANAPGVRGPRWRRPEGAGPG